MVNVGAGFSEDCVAFLLISSSNILFTTLLKRKLLQMQKVFFSKIVFEKKTFFFLLSWPVRCATHVVRNPPRVSPTASNQKRNLPNWFQTCAITAQSPHRGWRVEGRCGKRGGGGHFHSLYLHIRERKPWPLRKPVSICRQQRGHFPLLPPSSCSVRNLPAPPPGRKFTHSYSLL